MQCKRIKITVLICVLCTSITGYSQLKGVVEDSVKAKHQTLKECFEHLDKKFKPKLKEQNITVTNFKRTANQAQFLIEKKKIARIFGSTSGKRNLENTYNLLGEMVKKNMIELDVNYTITGTPTLIKAKNKRSCTYKTTAALKVDAKNYQLTSLAKNELTLTWTVEMKETRTENKIKSTKLTSIKSKAISGLFEHEKEQIQKIANGLIEEYYKNILSKKWIQVLLPEIPNKEDMRKYLINSTKIEKSGDIRVSSPNSQNVIVGEESVPFLIFHTSDGYSEQEQIFALTFHIKINDKLQEGEITKVEYRLSSTPPEPTPIPEPEPEPEIEFVYSPKIKEVGLTYKVQILALYEPLKISELPNEYRNIENVIMEESVIENKKYYQYVIPVGNNQKEAQTLKNKLIEQGIKSAWIVKYKDGKRIVYPTKTK